ncbi:MAG TPA: MurT ligase domain-containing protein [Chloroflexota bacterium]|nr:MurT ligase domain-containing protein [Chloroflexota bacterium]
MRIHRPDRAAYAAGAARTIAGLSRARGGGGTSLPGLIAERLAPRITERLAAQIAHGTIAVSGTNGKTTTSALVSAALAASGLRPLHNRAGANLLRGITSTLVMESGSRGMLHKPDAIGVFECDEAALPAICTALRPVAIVLTNLFRDQLDRYGEMQAIVQRWRPLIAGLTSRTTLVLNADDPLIAALGIDAPAKVVYFGMDCRTFGRAAPAENADSTSCPLCAAELAYDLVYYAHLGHYRCAHCGWARPLPAVRADAVVPRDLKGTGVVITVAEETVAAELRLPGVYNVYNALAAAATAAALDLSPRRAMSALSEVGPAFGRAETVRFAGRDLHLFLVKNPTGCDEVLHLLGTLDGPIDLLMLLNDNAADGHDVSWIWDSRVEGIAWHVRNATFGGTRAADLAVRFKYAGYPTTGAMIVPDIRAAITSATAATRDGGPLYIVATYTAMLAVRRFLAAQGVVKHYLDQAKGA